MVLTGTKALHTKIAAMVDLPPRNSENRRVSVARPKTAARKFSRNF
jgi:hypothetical protein